MISLLKSLRSDKAGPHRLAGLWREDPESLAEYLRVIYRDYVFNSPLALFISVYFYLVREDKRAWPELEVWMLFWVVYLVSRFVIGLFYGQRPAREESALHRWNWVAIAIQAVDGLMVSSLALFIYPSLDIVAQSAVLAATLVLVGATAFSLSGRWLSIAVYAPPIYVSFAWMTWHQGHVYSQGLAVFTLAMFGLYAVYANNQRRSALRGFKLAKLNGELAQQLRSKNAELQEVAQARSRLLATVSHDLRQPAHAIGLLAERALLDSSPRATQQSLNDLNALSQSLSASLSTLMDLTRLDAGLVEPRVAPLALEQVLRRLQAEFESMAQDKGLAMHIAPSSVWVLSDPVLLHGMLANLISNAIKYTSTGSIRVEVERVQDQVCVSVRDSGMGIRADKLDLIFKEFVRLDGSESGSEGLGLGLSIVKRYGLLLGHRLSVESELSRGSRFSVFLPLTAAERSEAHVDDPSAAGPSQLEGLRVLVVDNVDLLLSSMNRTLTGWGCVVFAAHDLAEALLLTRDQRVEVVISDFHLGDLEPDGLQLIAAIRARAPHFMPAVLMTGDVSAQLESRAQEESVKVLHKPVRPAILRAGLLELLEQASRDGRASQA